MQMKWQIRRGFTLVELLVVMAIIGILVVVGLASFRTSQIRSRDAQRKSDLRQIANAAELFYSDYEIYPPDDASGNIVACPYISGGTSTPCTWGTSEFRDADSNEITKTTYFRELPEDPAGGTYYYVSTDSSFKIYARLENTQDRDYPNDYGVPCGSQNCNFGITSTNTVP